MRYVNLKKRNTNKLQFIAKRLASVSVLCFCFTAVIVLPLIDRARTLQARIQNQEVDIVDEINENTIECNVMGDAEFVF